uniref:exodeoxyribonuclease III n=1 Tax=Nocardia brasiliensis TaxID=37326 RepID=UPI002453D7C9
MRLATWNVNSIRSRLDRVAEFLDRQDIDVLAIQETKCRDDQFPFERFDELGYEVAHLGINQWNGVAIVSRVGGGPLEAPRPRETPGGQEGGGGREKPPGCWGLLLLMLLAGGVGALPPGDGVRGQPDDLVDDLAQRRP